MAKPRDSVLYLFDPLQSPITPHRDSSSSDLSASDKENDVPPGDVTLFFDRMYALPKLQPAQVLTPKGKLIDIGDTPAPSDHLWDGSDGSDADGEQSESDAEGCGVVSPSRRPFAELDVEHTPRPLDSARRFKAPAFGIALSPSQGSNPLPALLVPAPQTSPLADVVNSINFSAMSLSAESTSTDTHLNHTQEAECSRTSRPSSPFPEINVCAPETPSMEHFDVPKGCEHAAIPTMVPPSHLRPTCHLTQLPPDDPRRTSVDLYSSFHLQMQSEEMSFDLLNDKISFFGHGQDSLWAAGDDAMEFEEMGLPPALKAKVDKLVSFIEPPSERSSRVTSPPVKTFHEVEMLSILSPTTEVAMNVPLPLSPTLSTPPSRHTTPSRLSLPSFDEPPSPPTSPVVADEPSLLLESEPLPPPVAQPLTAPVVPALRITKKTFKMAGHQSTVTAPLRAPAGVQPTEKPDLATKRRVSVARPAPGSVVAPQSTRPAIRGVQRPPAGMAVGGIVIALPPQGPSTSSSSSSAGSVGVAPASASRFAGIQRPNLAAKERAAPRSTSGATRPAVTGFKAAPASKAASGINTRTASLGKAAGAGVLRPPSRIVAPSSGSALPKPSSRLPGLSRTSSMSMGSAGTAAGSGAAAASRARSSTVSRMTGRF
ncbi:hypothetical protein GSI_02227 [Ganoderma sinense ZZ0214-1]|uniref:Uncharacterized protein n=1 Tax=Ganoderma sinense ZZ0214-1 TaxID=1077348 RepID=A0A2G8SP19_9APHY|nr:hypothetical protein GSI_02227 [Ganoderma sinense ZZ0214-1]